MNKYPNKLLVYEFRLHREAGLTFVLFLWSLICLSKYFFEQGINPLFQFPPISIDIELDKNFLSFEIESKLFQSFGAKNLDTLILRIDSIVLNVNITCSPINLQFIKFTVESHTVNFYFMQLITFLNFKISKKSYFSKVCEKIYKIISFDMLKIDYYNLIFLRSSKSKRN